MPRTLEGPHGRLYPQWEAALRASGRTMPGEVRTLDNLKRVLEAEVTKTGAPPGAPVFCGQRV